MDTKRQTYLREEVAEITGVSTKTIDRRIASGDLRVVRIGKCIRITHEELDRFLGREPR